MKKLLISMLFIFTPLVSHAKVYMCEEEGKTTFSQTPCEGDMQVIEVKESYEVDNEAQMKAQKENEEYLLKYKEKKEKEHAERMFRRKISSAINQQQIMVGMTEEEVVRSWGKPSDINSSGGSHGSRDQYVYRRGNNETQYVYLKNGFVTSWSNN